MSLSRLTALALTALLSSTAFAGTTGPTNPVEKPKAPAIQSDASSSTLIFAHKSVLATIGRCSRMSASSLLNRMAPVDEVRNIPRNAKVIECR